MHLRCVPLLVVAAAFCGTVVAAPRPASQTNDAARSLEPFVAALKEAAGFLKNAQSPAGGGFVALVGSQGAVLRALDPIRASKQESAAVSKLLEILRVSTKSDKPDDEFMAAVAVFALGELTTFAKAAVSELNVLASQSPSALIKEYAASALKKIS